MSCDCGLPVGSTYYHCKSCCSTYQYLYLWDAHRVDGHCMDLEGVYEDDGIWSTAEGHNKRKELSLRFRNNRS